MTSNSRANTDNSKAATQALLPPTNSLNKAPTRATNTLKVNSHTPASPDTDQQTPVLNKRATVV